MTADVIPRRWNTVKQFIRTSARTKQKRHLRHIRPTTVFNNIECLNNEAEDTEWQPTDEEEKREGDQNLICLLLFLLHPYVPVSVFFEKLCYFVVDDTDEDDWNDKLD